MRPRLPPTYEENIGKIQKSNLVEIVFSGLPGMSFSGYITQIGTQANDTKTFPVVIEMINKNNLIKGGMVAETKISFDSYKNAIVIPLYLVQKSLEGYYVFVEDKGIAVRRDIKIAEIQGEEVHVISGLNIGDQLIVEGYKFVTDGTKVQIKPTMNIIQK